MKAKKSLGQNFLKSETALRKIIEAGEIKPTDTILEIGPGKGALTEKLLEKAGLVIAIEKDKELISFLQEKFSTQIKNGSLVIKNEDILEFEIKNYKIKNYKIIANIPYNITGAILKKFLTENEQPTSMVLMVQNEVAKRIVARDNKESILSISVKAYGTPKMIMKVEARYFSPKPKVDSAIIAINNISRQIFEKNGVNEEKFWEIVKTGFAHKRKKLGGNLKNILTSTNDKQKVVLNDLKNKRAEDLTLLDWIALANI
ncbi:16S rRNA (adenine(1518)-N(6)/adenine(1519)-N(6))-dimethyltransferase RsmA [Candidatus Nomurabacteria bacterium]|nr:16S rRNA (adenine(1518)-N(6)/adenine(1519)-N(6))-dimethyltransferase RsmA [Candidatus Nomurabacteria bacterium]